MRRRLPSKLSTRRWTMRLFVGRLQAPNCGRRQQPHRRSVDSPNAMPETKKVAEPADKPGPVLDSHSSRRSVTATLKQPTRTRRGQRHEVPIWPCSRWGLPCRPVARLAVRSYRTISPLPRASCDAVRRYLSVALSVGSRRPGVTWHRALWSPDFPRHSQPPKWMRMTRLPGRLRRAHCRTRAASESARSKCCPT